MGSEWCARFADSGVLFGASVVNGDQLVGGSSRDAGVLYGVLQRGCGPACSPGVESGECYGLVVRLFTWLSGQRLSVAFIWVFHFVGVDCVGLC